MKEKKERAAKTAAQKVTIKADTAIAAYRLLTTPKTEGKDGFRLSTLETADIFKVLRAADALKPVAVAFDDFHKDAQERLKPENWDELIEKYGKFQDLTDEEKVEVNKSLTDYNNKVAECVRTKLYKENELDAYERLPEEALGRLIKDNGHLLDVQGALLLREVLC